MVKLHKKKPTKKEKKKIIKSKRWSYKAATQELSGMVYTSQTSLLS